MSDDNVNYPDNLDWMSQRGRAASAHTGDDKKCPCGEIQACDVCLETRRVEIDAPATSGGGASEVTGPWPAPNQAHNKPAPAPSGGEAKKTLLAFMLEEIELWYLRRVHDGEFFDSAKVSEAAEKNIDLAFEKAATAARAATEARVRAEVWGKAYAAFDGYSDEQLRRGGMSRDEIREFYEAAAISQKRIEEAAKADGVDLTSLTDDDA